MSLFDFSLFARGGPMMGVLLAMGLIAAVVMFVERTLYLHRGQIRSTAFINGIKNILAKRRPGRGAHGLRGDARTGGRRRQGGFCCMPNDKVRTSMRFYVQEAAVVDTPRPWSGAWVRLPRSRRRPPMVGLLGTIIGMITTFLAFEHPLDHATPARAFQKGMWEALLAQRRPASCSRSPRTSPIIFSASRVRAIVRDVEWSAN